MEETHKLPHWDREFALRIVQSVNRLREMADWSIPTLRTRLKAVGWEVSIDTLNGILSTKKRKSFSIGEVLSFANAFGVPPEFLLLGLPSMADLPEQPVLGSPAVVDVFRWYRGIKRSVYDGSALSPLERYARILDDLERENAIWHINGEARTIDTRPGRSVNAVAWYIDKLRDHLAYWSSLLGAGVLAPDLPPIPVDLAPYLEPGAAAPESAIEGLLDPRIIAEVESDMDRWAAAKADVDRMGGPQGGEAADSAQ